MLLALFFLVAAFLILFDLIQPTYGDLQTKKGTQLSEQTFLTNEQQVVNQAKNLISQYESESQAQNNLVLAMPSGPNVASALAQIYGIATNNGVTVSNISLGPPTVSLQSQAQAAGTQGALTPGQILKPMGMFSIQLTAVGSYESLKNFLAQLETNIRVFDLTGFSLQGAAAPAPSGKAAAAATSDLFSYNFSINTYYQLP